jgi:elongation factor 1 alpha-like protein
MSPQNYDPDDLADYDEDDYDNEEDELSPEDKVAMANGTAEVRKVLGADGSKLTAKQIQDALWHYYYDVDKSVAYLRKTYLPSQPKATPKKAPEGEYGLISSSSRHELWAGTTGPSNKRLASHESTYPVVNPSRAPISLEFSDMPWLSVPRHLMATFVGPPRPRGGLLGGGLSKMSKLQALAASRKQKSDLKDQEEKTTQAEAGMNTLSISESQKENQPPFSPAKRQKLYEHSAAPLQDIDGTSSVQPLSQASETLSHEASTTGSPAVVAEESQSSRSGVICEKSRPSAFARTLFGPAGAPSPRKKEVFPMPYTSSSAFLATAFTQPSPDDVVLAAQAKGSNFAREK